jgi:tyrosyl-tRNA synthetase
MPKNIPTLDEVLTRGVTEILPSKETLADLMSQKKIKLYLGIDPTGSELTLGHSVVLRKLQQFANLGHEVILLIGGGTVKIGDPTGKDTTRPELTNEQIQANFKNWQKQASKILDFSKIKIMNNADWLDQLTYVDLIKIMAKTTIQQLMERDMFQERLKAGRPIHAHEIIYPLMQGYDSVHMNVDLEIGGNDQTFNMMMGRTLQKIYNDHEKWVLTTPIINGLDGRKMSKSYGNYVSLSENPIDMYGKLMRVNDEMIIDYFTVLTDVPMDEITAMQQQMDSGENPMTFKKQLALTITTMYHDQAAANDAQQHFEQTIQGDNLPTNIPEIKLSSETNTLGEILKLCLPEESNSNLRRLVEQGGVELTESGEKPTDFHQRVKISDGEVIRVGKRKYFKLINKSNI